VAFETHPPGGPQALRDVDSGIRHAVSVASGSRWKHMSANITAATPAEVTGVRPTGVVPMDRRPGTPAARRPPAQVGA
jgi:hypothetical protein